MPKKKTPLDDLIPPSGVRAAPEKPAGGVYFSLNLRDMIAEIATKVRDGDPETLAKLGVAPPPVEEAGHDDEAPPDTQRSPKA